MEGSLPHKLVKSHFEVTSTLEELKKSKQLVLENHCALNKFFCAMGYSGY